MFLVAFTSLVLNSAFGRLHSYINWLSGLPPSMALQKLKLLSQDIQLDDLHL